jgi:signal transduction histidine kinase
MLAAHNGGTSVQQELGGTVGFGTLIEPTNPQLRLEHASFLADASKQLASSLDYEITVASVARLAIPTLADYCALDILDNDGMVRRLAVAHIDPAKESLGFELAQPGPPSAIASRGVMQVLRSGRPSVLRLADESAPGSTSDAGDLQALRALGFDSVIIVPMVAGDRMLGALTFAAAEPRRPYELADLTLVEEFADRCALAVDHARLYRQAQDALERRDAYLATVSHDLKNPLALIAGQAQLLRRVAEREGAPSASRVSQGLGRIETTVARMTGMIDELLDVTSLELGHQLELQSRPMDMVGLMRRKVSEYEQTTDRHVFRVAAETDLLGVWDSERLERVLDNLLGNAIKYTPDGGVITVIVVRDDDEPGAWAVVSVRDPGVGIPPADLPRIFDRFQRAGNVGRIAGTGIGLAVARHIVEQHGGNISVESVEGKGSTFTIRLPC